MSGEMSRPQDDPLAIDAEQMRRLGYRTVDMLVDRLSDPTVPPLVRATPLEMAERLSGPPPETGEDFDALLRQLTEDVLRFTSRVDHPGYFAFIPGSGTWPGALGDFIAAACNIYAGSWMEAAGPSRVELVVIDWFRQWIGFPPEASGILLSGGSAANMTALACARESLVGTMSDRVVVYVSDQAHSSMARTARILGFRPDQVRVLPVDNEFRMRPDLLVDAMDTDVRAGRQPLFVSASAGSTNTGAIDPLPEIGEVCRERGVWFHVDGAYGAFAALTERGGAWLAGIERADSVTLDPHKWLYQPFECGGLLVRDGSKLREAFRITPEYLKDAEVEGVEVNFCDLGTQLTRSTRALKIWLSLRYFGLNAFRSTIDRSLDVARAAQARIEASDSLELLHPASLSIVCFRRQLPGVEEAEVERVNNQLVHDFADSGIGLVSSTRLHGRFAVRLCALNHTTAEADAERVLEWFETAPIAVEGPARPDGNRRTCDVGEGWLGAVEGRRDALRSLPIFGDLPMEEIDQLALSGKEREAAAGDPVVRQWDASREFYVVLDGALGVFIDGERVATYGPGDFFGELAAMEWGASFSYPRLASVVAESAIKVLVVPPGRFNQLLHDLPQFAHLIRQTAGDRLAAR
ncbi:MAG: aminotransferase class V-fold PLP-dependent enzyme [Actinomycetota bacterium]